MTLGFRRCADWHLASWNDGGNCARLKYQESVADTLELSLSSLFRNPHTLQLPTATSRLMSSDRSLLHHFQHLG